MPSIQKLPKDTLFLYANDLDDFQNVKLRWETNAWCISADYKDHVYSCIALIYGRPCVVLYQEPFEEAAAADVTPGPEEAAAAAPDQTDSQADDADAEEQAATEKAIEQLHS